MSDHPGWIQLGSTVAYYPNEGSKTFHVGIVDSRPRLLGGVTWVVTLRDMDPTYRDGQRRTVPAAACNCLKPYDLIAEYARLRDERVALWVVERRERILREALERIRKETAEEPEPDVAAIWKIASGALQAAEALAPEPKS
jgi:hypothetical protein